MKALLIALCFVVSFVSAAELQDLRDWYEAQIELETRKVLKDRDAMLERFRAAFLRLETAVQQEGNLDLALAYREAKTQLEEGGDPVLAAEPLASYEGYSRLWQTWEKVLSDLENTRAVEVEGVYRRFTQLLEKQEVEATRSGEIEKALSFRAEKDRLSEDPELQALLERAALIREARSAESAGGGAGMMPMAPMMSTLTRDMVLYFSFDRDEGERVRDRSPARNEGKRHGGRWVREGRRGGGFQVGEGERGIEVPNAESLQLTEDLSLAFWMKPDKLEGRRNPIHKSYGGEFAMTLEPDGRISAYHGIAGRDAHPYQGLATDEKRVEPGQWAHVVMVRNKERVVIYVNGESWAAAGNTHPVAKASGGSLLIGWGYAGQFIGSLDEVLILKRALEEKEIRGLYRAMGGR